jgi:hypothetical protein
LRRSKFLRYGLRMSDAQLNEALQGMSAGLAADGYTLDARWADDGRVRITVDATPDACADCLVPRDVMRSIAATMLGNAGVNVSADDVDVTYPEGSAAH